MAARKSFLRALIPLWVALVALLVAALPAGAESGDPSWRGEYFANPYLAGSPTVVRQDPAINFNWGSGAPDWNLPADRFSVRWTRMLYFDAGRYYFSAITDDGVRLWVDGNLIVNDWSDHPAARREAEISLGAGYHILMVEYYENGGQAVAQLSWRRTDGDVQGWRGEYYSNTSLSGWPAVVRGDAAIDFNWGAGSPDRNVPSDNFSVRWTRTLSFVSGRYEFTTATDDGVRLWVDGRLLIDQWHASPGKQYKAQVYLNEGPHTIRMEYYEGGGTASARLWWRGPLTDVTVGNIVTCVPPYPSYSWIKVYRLEPDGSWRDLNPHGYASIEPTGFLAIGGLPVEYGVYGDAGHPYRVEQWVDGSLARSVGNTARGEPPFRVIAGKDNYTPWQCPAR